MSSSVASRYNSLGKKTGYPIGRISSLPSTLALFTAYTTDVCHPIQGNVTTHST